MAERILFINYEYPPIGGGGATANYHFARILASQGTGTFVVTSAFGDNRGYVSENGVTVIRLPALRKKPGQSSLPQMLTFLCSALFHLPGIFRSIHPEVVIIFFAFPCGPLGLVLKWFWKIPYVIMLRGGDVPGFEPSLSRIHRLLRPIRRTVYHNSSAIIANSNSLRDLALTSDPDISVKVLPNGVDTVFFHPANQAQSLERPFTFLFAGRLCTQKNLDVLIESFSRCHSRMDTCALVIIGDGPERSRLQQLTADRSLNNSVQWRGWCTKEKLRASLHLSDCFVNPSSYEGMSNAILEAMACGLPVLAGDCPANREIVVDGKSGYLITPGDIDALSEKMFDYASNRESANQHGSFSRSWCLENCSWDSNTRKLRNILEDIRACRIALNSV